jgi:hypothetical protein
MIPEPTEEMIEAGATALRGCRAAGELGFKHLNGVELTAIYLAMEAAREPEATQREHLLNEIVADGQLLLDCKAWLQECHDWLLTTDLDMQCPMEVDPLDLIERIDRSFGLPVREAREPEAGKLREALEECERLTKLLNTPEVDDFAKGAVLEAAHQRERWAADHDVGKTPFDWFWLVGYLAQKAATSAVNGDAEKARHHTISTAAALANWHLALSGTDTRMVPGAPLPIIREADAA